MLCARQRGKCEGKHVFLARARVHRFSFFAFTASPTLRNLLRLRALGVKTFVFTFFGWWRGCAECVRRGATTGREYGSAGEAG